MPPVVLIPLNELGRAKTRLAEMLDQEERKGLATATFATVALAAERAGLEVVVLAARPEDVTGYDGVRVMPERADRSGLNAQLEAAIEELAADEVLILHADLPLVKPGDLLALLDDAPPAPSVTLVRSRDGGTNAMLVRPPGGFPLRYGPGSFDLHVEAARAAGYMVEQVENDHLSLDLDTPEDVDAFMAHPASTGRAVRMILEQMLAEKRP